MKQSEKKSIAIMISACIACLSCFGGTAAAAESVQAESEISSAAETAPAEESASEEESTSAEESASTDSLYTHGLEIISLLSEMVQSEYPELLTTSDDILSVIQDILDDDFSSPKAVYSISLAEGSLSAVEELNRLETSSDALKAYYMRKVLVSLINRVNAMDGAETLAASSICTAGSLFVDENADTDKIYLYTFDDAVPVAVVFSVGEDHAVSADGMFVLYKDFACSSVEELKEFFDYLPVEVDEVQMPDPKN